MKTYYQLQFVDAPYDYVVQVPTLHIANEMCSWFAAYGICVRINKVTKTTIMEVKQ